MRFAAFLISFLLIGVAFSSHKSSSPKAIMISIDGFRPEFYQSQEFEMPTVQHLIKNGAFATGAVPVFPSVTYPNHTTLITGEASATHGILSNTVFDWKKGPLPGWYWEYSKIKIPTILDIAQSHKLTTASIRWPVTLGGKADYLIPEIFGMKGYYEGSDWELTVKYTDPKLMGELQANLVQKSYSNNEEADHWASQAANFIWAKYNPNLMIVHLADVDHQEHSYGRNGNEIKKAVKEADENIKTILNNIDLNTTCVFIVGDHGFYNVSKTINPNVLFLKKGWIEIDSKRQITSWKVIAHSSGGQAAIYVKDKSLISKVEVALVENQKLGYRLYDKTKMNLLEVYPDADFVISGYDGFTVSSSLPADVVTNASVKGQHGHMPDDSQMHTGFVVSGCGVTAGQNLGIISNLDVAPTIAKYIGFEFKTEKSSGLKILRDWSR